MRTIFIILIAVSGAVVATAGPVVSQTGLGQSSEALATAPSGGMLRTLPHGEYQCALPGDAGGPAFKVVQSESFRISTASRYSVAEGDGTYILNGDRLTFTAGPKNGERFERVGENQLRKLDASGESTDLLCTRLADRRQ